MKIDLSCPAELWRAELPKADRPACELTMYNLCDRLITSMEVTLTLLDEAHEELQRVIYRAHALRGLPEKTFSLAVPVEDSVRAAHCEVVVEKIWFDDSSVWRRGKAPLTEYASNALPPSPALERLRFIAGKDAAGYPQEQGGLWLCVCGRPNPSGSHSCVRCRRGRTEVFASLTREAVEKQSELRERQLSLKGKEARERASLHQAQREKEYEEKKRRARSRAILCACCAVLLAAAYGVVFHLLPWLNYQHAVELMDAGSYGEAIAAFSNMGDYGEAPAHVTRCTYLEAAAQLDSADEKALVSARDTLLSLGEYEDAADLAREAEYLRAGLVLEDGRIAEARTLYESLHGYKDSDACITRCDYLTAQALLEEGDYESAREALLALGDYENAPALAAECLYRPAQAFLEEGDYKSALVLLVQIPEHNEAPALLRKAYYLKAEDQQAAGDVVAAGESFLLAEDEERARSCFYQAADAASRKGDHVTAAELFGRALGHEDAAERWNAETYTLAVDAIGDLEYIRARALLASLPEDYQDVATLRKEARYLPALAAMKKGDYASAEAALAALPGYKDSDEKLKEARYALAKKQREAGEYEAALALFALLDGYEDTDTEVTLTRYRQASAMLTSGDYAGAEAIFADLGKYKDSDSRLKEASYGHAGQLLEAGDYDDARARYAALGKYSDARKQLSLCDYRKAAALAAEGKTAEAAELYMSLDSYEDARQQGQALYYALAQTAEAEGRSADAAALYELIPGYADASARASALHEAVYGPLRTRAREARDAGDYAMAVAVLHGLDFGALPDGYGDLKELYREACYAQANRLYEEHKPYEALPFYQLIPDYRDVQEILGRSCYLLLGQWLGENGNCTFLPDGTCILGGEAMHFSVDTYALQTGAEADSLTLTHRISSISRTRLSLRDVRTDSGQVVQYTRDEAFTLPAAPLNLPEVPKAEPEPTPVPTSVPEAQATPAPETAPDPDDSFQVVDE